MRLDDIIFTALQSLTVVAAHSVAQKPLVNFNEGIPVNGNQWNFNFSSEGPHYFASAFGLLQQWSNTFFPNGYSLVPCEIAPLTTLYHGRADESLPPSPEWLAFDVEMSYAIMGGSRNSHMLTYQTTHKVKCLYFDGESATLFGTGQMHSQMLQIWGNVSGPYGLDHGRLWGEYDRAAGLCDWLQAKELGGSGWGYEGIVRMNVGFEMIWCNFSSPSLRLLSHLNVTAPLLPGKDGMGVTDEPKINNSQSDMSNDPPEPLAPPDRGRDSDRQPFRTRQGWTWYLRATDHYGSSANGPGLGETRVKPLTCGFMSYYSPRFLSQALQRNKIEQKTLNLTILGLWAGPGEVGSRVDALAALTRRRRSHELSHISPSDAAVFRADSERILRDFLSPSPEYCSEIEWAAMVNTLVQTYARPLSTLSHSLGLFENLTTTTNHNDAAFKYWLTDIRGQFHDFLMPYLEYPDGEFDPSVWKQGSQLYNETYSRCRLQSTWLLALEDDLGSSLSPQETELKDSIEEVASGICFTLITIGFSVESLWDVRFNVPLPLPYSTPEKQPSSDTVTTRKEIIEWSNGIQELMAWLGWAGEWIGCAKKCAWDESCYIEMWPLMAFDPGRRRRYGYRYGYRGPGRYEPPPGPGYGDGGGPPYRYRPEYGGGPPPGGVPELSDEKDLWEPKCVKKEYVSGW